MNIQTETEYIPSGTATGVRAFLSAMSEMRTLGKSNLSETPKGWRWRSVDDLILAEGKAFTPAPLPSGVRRGVIKMCHQNAGRLALSNRRFTYCEGYAAGIIPLMHAWCVDPDGRVVDPTWPDGKEYFGVPIRASYLRRTILKSGRWGVLDCWEERWPMLRHSVRTWKQPLG